MNSDFITMVSQGIDNIISELKQYSDEADLWKVEGKINNSAGNLALHLTGSLNYFIGNVMSGNGYVRNREAEFSDKHIPRQTMMRNLEETKAMIADFLSQCDAEFYTAIFPLSIFGDNRSNHYVLTIMIAHLNYHLGQINYHRRLIAK